MLKGTPQSDRVWFDFPSAVRSIVPNFRLPTEVVAVGAIVLGLLLHAVPAEANGVRTSASEDAPVRHIVVTLNKSRTFALDQPIRKAVVGAPEIADVLPMTDRSIYIQGKKIGTTNISIFNQEQKLVAVIGLEVTLANGDLQRKIIAATGNRGIRVT